MMDGWMDGFYDSCGCRRRGGRVLRRQRRRTWKEVDGSARSAEGESGREGGGGGRPRVLQQQHTSFGKEEKEEEMSLLCDVSGSCM